MSVEHNIQLFVISSSIQGQKLVKIFQNIINIENIEPENTCARSQADRHTLSSS